METHYSLSGLRATLAFDEVCLSASVWRGNSKVGNVEECPDTGKVIIEFRCAQERARFEEFIRRWWQEADYQALCTAQVRALIKQDANHELPVKEKIRCWVKHLAGPIERSSDWKWQTRAARQLLRSF